MPDNNDNADSKVANKLNEYLGEIEPYLPNKLKFVTLCLVMEYRVFYQLLEQEGLLDAAIQISANRQREFFSRQSEKSNNN